MPAPTAAPVSNEQIQRTMIANALWREQMNFLSLSARHGGNDATRGVAKLMVAAFEARKAEIIAEVSK
jgi:hypothetical protein